MRAKTVNENIGFTRDGSAKDALAIGAEKVKIQSPGDGFFLYMVMLIEPYTGPGSETDPLGLPKEMWKARITKIIQDKGGYYGAKWQIGDKLIVRKFTPYPHT